MSPSIDVKQRFHEPNHERSASPSDLSRRLATLPLIRTPERGLAFGCTSSYHHRRTLAAPPDRCRPTMLCTAILIIWTISLLHFIDRRPINAAKRLHDRGPIIAAVQSYITIRAFSLDREYGPCHVPCQLTRRNKRTSWAKHHKGHPSPDEKWHVGSHSSPIPFSSRAFEASGES